MMQIAIIHAYLPLGKYGEKSVSLEKWGIVKLYLANCGKLWKTFPLTKCKKSVQPVIARGFSFESFPQPLGENLGKTFNHILAKAENP
ncbi:MAG: hypothetical protein MJ186_03960 [Clostridia bacterium]|nr:hypothetical protein [Clostridia bacterium]